MKLLYLFLITLLCFDTTAQGKFVVCEQLNSNVTFKKAAPFYVSIEAGDKILYEDFDFDRAINDNQGELSCNEIYHSIVDTVELVAYRAGHNNDLLLVFALLYKDSKVTDIYRLFWRILDVRNGNKFNPIDIYMENTGVVVTYGWKGDVHRRIKFDKDTKKWLWSKEAREVPRPGLATDLLPNTPEFNYSHWSID